MTALTLRAARDLALVLDDATHWRLAWGEPDWLGPIGFALHCDGRWHRSPGVAPAGNDDPLTSAGTVTATPTAFTGTDDLGPFQGVELRWAGAELPARTAVRAYAHVPVVVVRLEATTPIGVAGGPAIATGTFQQPSSVWPFLQPARRAAGGVPANTRSYGHQYAEFAPPVNGTDTCTGYLFAPHRPPVVEPLLLIAPDGRTLLLAPLDGFHEQIIVPPPDASAAAAGVRCGWHGDLAEIPAGFRTELAVWAADRPRAALEAWAALLRRRHATQRRSRYADDLVGRLSYWTDNGAVYYYRTEPGCDYTETLSRAVSDLHERDVPVRSVQVDSFFYPHEILRAVSDAGADIVPPTGMMRWEPREDLFPDGFRDLRRRVGDLPLTFHSRHFSTRSPYFDRYAAWRDGDYAHPCGPELYDLLIGQAATWGAITYEQDWMVESFLGVRGLRAAPGRARAWQQAMDRAAEEHGLHVQWCMSTPADFMETVTLRQVASIRTSGDYRYLFDNGLNWAWFLHVNAMARALGLIPFKDVFISHGATPQHGGEPYAEIEALLAALSAGPVGIGDQIGHTVPALVLRTCRDDGVLIKPDVPIAALDRCFHANAFFAPALLVGDTWSEHPAGTWRYVATFNAYKEKETLSDRVAVRELGPSAPSGPVVVYDWRQQSWTRVEADGGWEVRLGFQDWDYRVVCPWLDGITVFGDVGKYATAGDKRVAGITRDPEAVAFDVLGAPEQMVEVRGCAEHAPRGVSAWVPGTARPLARDADPAREGWTWDADSGLWTVRVRVPGIGQTRVSVRVG